MKKILSYILLGGVIAFSSCEKKEVNYTPKNYAPAPSVSATVGVVADSTANIEFNADNVGKVYYALVTKQNSEITAEEIIEKDVLGATENDALVIPEGAGAFGYMFKDLVQDTDYFMYYVSGSPDGEYQKVVTETTFSTSDIHAPVFLGGESNPPFQAYPVDINLPQVELQFDEPVIYDGVSSVFITFYFSGIQVEILPADISADGSKGIINLQSVLPLIYGDFVIVEVPTEGTFADAVGNLAAPIVGFQHYFRARFENDLEIMSAFIGTNDYTILRNGGGFDSGQVDVVTKEGDDNVVIMSDYIFGNVNLEFIFNLDVGLIDFQTLDTGWYYDTDAGGFVFGEIEDPSIQGAVLYVPVPTNFAPGYAGAFDTDAGQFVVELELVIQGFGTFGVFTHQFQKVVEAPIMDSSTSKTNNSLSKLIFKAY
jgi:hypothetical protein